MYKGWWCGVEIVFVLNWFNYDGGDIFWCGIIFEDLVDVGDSVIFVYVV